MITATTDIFQFPILDSSSSSLGSSQESSLEIEGVISSQLGTVQRFGSALGNQIGNGFSYASSAFLQTVDKAEQFLYRNKDTIFYVGCSATTAYFSPYLFAASAAATAIGRIELTRKLRNFSDEYLRDDKNPYKQNSRYSSYMTPLEITMGAAAAANAIALSALVITNPCSTLVMPMIGGAAVGSGIAKAGMNLTSFLKS